MTQAGIFSAKQQNSEQASARIRSSASQFLGAAWPQLGQALGVIALLLSLCPGCSDEFTSCGPGSGDERCALGDTSGVFVSPTGDDTSGDGSQQAPYATLAKGVEKALSRDQPVYACGDGGAFTETLLLEEQHSGIELFGGLSCADWSWHDTVRVRVEAPAHDAGPEYALRIHGIKGLSLNNFEFIGADATRPGESSFGAWISESEEVAFDNVVLSAGSGADGAAGTTVEFEYPSRTLFDGQSADGIAGGAAVVFESCPGGGTTAGGSGGDGGPAPGNGSNGQPSAKGGGVGGREGQACNAGGGGGDAMAAPPAKDGAGAKASGALAEDTSEWVGVAGSDGVTGVPGPGGGGGAGTSDSEASVAGGGGGGAAGGCGGNGGKGGGGAGSSIALLAINASISVSGVTLVASDAGSGGAGDAGQVGQLGGTGGSRTGDACNGGKGGKGASGGGGGGGGGGSSLGIAWYGTPVTPLPKDVELGKPGVGGLGAGDANSGVDGAAEVVLELGS